MTRVGRAQHCRQEQYEVLIAMVERRRTLCVGLYDSDEDLVKLAGLRVGRFLRHSILYYGLPQENVLNVPTSNS